MDNVPDPFSFFEQHQEPFMKLTVELSSMPHRQGVRRYTTPTISSSGMPSSDDCTRQSSVDLRDGGRFVADGSQGR